MSSASLFPCTLPGSHRSQGQRISTAANLSVLYPYRHPKTAIEAQCIPRRMAGESKVRRHAILIGINSHDSEHGSGLKGCVCDIDEITRQLEQSNIQHVSIHRYTATLELDSPQPIEPKEQWPTHDNITSCLSKVTQHSRRGDLVYVHFSGHSTVVPPTHSYSNWEAGDLALVVLEGEEAEERYLHGSEIAHHLKNMVDRGIGVTMVLDCCYSGSTLRNDEVVRYAPYRPEIDAKYPPRLEAQQQQDSSHQSASRGSRQTSLVPTWLADREGYTILTSSDATEKAYNVKFQDGSRHGTLTYFLLETFDELGRVGGTMHQLAESVRTRILDHRRNHQTRTQNPVLFGNKTQLFFGLPGPACPGNIPITRVSDDMGMGGAIRLHAGAAHGISEGDQCLLHPLSPRDAKPLKAEASTVRGLTSDLRITTTPDSDHNSVQTGWLAEITTRLALRQFPVQLDINQASQPAWDEALGEHPSLATCAKQEGPPSFTITQTETNATAATCTTYTIRNHQNQLLITTGPTPARPNSIHATLHHLHHLATYALIRALSNPSASPPTALFKTSFSALLINTRTNTAHSPGCAVTQNPYHTCAHPTCQIVLTPADRVRLVVTNLAERRLFLHLYAMGSGWEVECMTQSSREVVAPAGTGQGSGGVFRRTMRFSLEDGDEACEDTVKVFATRAPSCFASLEMGRLGGDGEGRAEEGRRGRGAGAEDDVWAAVTFQVRVVRGGS